MSRLLRALNQNNRSPTPKVFPVCQNMLDMDEDWEYWGGREEKMEGGGETYSLLNQSDPPSTRFDWHLINSVLYPSVIMIEDIQIQLLFNVLYLFRRTQ